MCKPSALAAPDSMFFGLDMEGAQLQGADCRGVIFGTQTFETWISGGQSIVDAKLTGAVLRGADLSPLAIGDGRSLQTDFSRASLRRASR